MPNSDSTPNPIGIGADHGGFELKQHLIKERRAASYEVVDFGDSERQPKDDYPDFVVALARTMADGDVERGNGHREDELKKPMDEKRGLTKRSTASGRKHWSNLGESADNELLIKPNMCMSATRIEDKSALDAPMNAVIIYGKFDFAARANAIVERAAHRADETTHWSVKQWRVEVLKLLIAIKEAYKG